MNKDIVRISVSKFISIVSMTPHIILLEVFQPCILLKADKNSQQMKNNFSSAPEYIKNERNVILTSVSWMKKVSYL
jgi:hypothetical protein